MNDTADVDDFLDTDMLRGLGKRIRELRVERDLTLSALSEMSQISVGMISHIERGKASPSLKLLERLRVALGVPLSRFFETPDAGGAEQSTVTRAGSRSVLSFSAIGLTKELLSPPGQSGLEVLLLTVDVDGSSGPDPWRRNGEKAGYVVQGRFELRVGAQTFVLEEGDAFQFDSRLPHSFRNLGGVAAKVIWVIRTSEAG